MSLKGGAYIWTRNLNAPAKAKLPIVGTKYGPHWFEQAVLFPEAEQQADMFGMRGLALSGRLAVVGAHNRDAFISKLNSGAAFAYDLRFLNLKFEKLEYSVSEASSYANITIYRCHQTDTCIHGSVSDQSLPFNYVTGDGIDTGLPKVRVEPTYFTHAEGVCTSRGNGCASTANGRSDCHVRSLHMNDCEFVKGNARTTELSRYDIRARSDYAPEIQAEDLINGSNTFTYKVIITNDNFLEVPDERINLRITSPGMQPSFGGPLWSVLTIVNDGDGGYGNRNYFDKIIGTKIVPKNEFKKYPYFENYMSETANMGKFQK